MGAAFFVVVLPTTAPSTEYSCYVAMFYVAAHLTAIFGQDFTTVSTLYEHEERFGAYDAWVINVERCFGEVKLACGKGLRWKVGEEII